MEEQMWQEQDEAEAALFLLICTHLRSEESRVVAAQFSLPSLRGY